MRKLVVSVLTTLDGYFEGPDGDLAGLPFEEAFDEHNLGLLRETQTLVYGSTWFENNWRFWAEILADASSSDRNRRIAELVTAMDSLIVSDSLVISPDDPWAATARVVSREEAPREIAALRQGDGGDLLMFGSATTWNPLLEQGLVDELIILVGPTLLGTGAPLYTGAPATLHLLDADILPHSSLVALRYAPTVAPTAAPTPAV